MAKSTQMTTMRRKVIDEKTQASKAVAPLKDISDSQSDIVEGVQNLDNTLNRVLEQNQQPEIILNQEIQAEATERGNKTLGDISAAEELSLEQREQQQKILEQIQKNTVPEMQETQQDLDDFAPISGPVSLPAVLPPPIIQVPEFEKPEPEKVLPQNEDNKEKGKSSILEGIVDQLKKMNSGITGLAGSVSRILFQMTLDAVKMLALLTAGVLAFDTFATIAQVIWAKYGDQIKEAFEWIKNTLTDVVQGVKDAVMAVWNNSLFKTMLENIAYMFQDLKDGTWVEGLMRQTQEGFKLIMFMIKDAFAALMGSIPGLGDAADQMKIQNSEDKLAAGFALSAGEKDRLAKYRADGNNEDQIKTRLKKRMEQDPNSGLEVSMWTGNFKENEAYKKAYAEEKERATQLSKLSPEWQMKIMDVEAAQGKLDRSSEYASDDSRSQGTAKMIQNNIESLKQQKAELENAPQEVRDYFSETLDKSISEAETKLKTVTENQKKWDQAEKDKTLTGSLKTPKMSEPDVVMQPVAIPAAENKSEPSPVNVNTAVSNVNTTQNNFIPSRFNNATVSW
jgi:hypothetical protein